MKTAFAVCAILAALLGVAWYIVPQEVEIATLRKDVASFQTESLNRSVTNFHAKMIVTSKGSFSIGTSEADRDPSGGLVFHGPGRDTGYFVAPPMRWVAGIDEAQKVIIDLYRKEGGDPIVVTDSSSL